MPYATPVFVAVVVNWNGRHLIDDTLESLAGQDYPDLATLVVDNGSTDGSVEYLADEWPGVHVLSLPDNQGFPTAVNRGIAASSGEFVAVLNNDMELHPAWASALAGALAEVPSAASAGGKLLKASQREILDGAGDVIGWDGYSSRRGQGKVDVGQYDERALVVSACAGAAMYRRRALEVVGPFDERFFAYAEDTDWGFRAQLAGFDCVYEPTSVAYHVGAATSSKRDGFELYQFHRNSVWMMVKNFPLAALVLHAPWAIGRRLVSLASAIRGGNGMVVLRAWRDAARGMPRYMGERRRIQRRRARGFRQLSKVVPVFTPRRER